MLRELQEGSSISRNRIDIAEERIMLASSDLSCFILSCSHKKLFPFYTGTRPYREQEIIPYLYTRTIETGKCSEKDKKILFTKFDRLSPVRPESHDEVDSAVPVVAVNVEDIVAEVCHPDAGAEPKHVRYRPPVPAEILGPR